MKTIRILKRFIKGCFMSAKATIYVDWFPAFPKPDMNLDYFEKKWHLKELKSPIKIMCIKANWKLANRLNKEKQ